MQSIFISSTFQDMQFERDIIHRRVLPELKDFSRLYGTSVDFSDLRWGIDSKGLTEDESTVKIIQVCFREIEKSKPYILVLLGDRYGWVPDADQVCAIMEHQGIHLSAPGGKSITQLEIEYGALNQDLENAECLFYFRTISNLKEMRVRSPEVYPQYVSGGFSDRIKLTRLKSAIRQRYPERVREYTLSWDPEARTFRGLEDFSAMVQRDLRRCMQNRLGRPRQLRWQELEERNFWFDLEANAFELTAHQLGSGIHADAVSGLLENRLPERIRSLWLSGAEGCKLDIQVASTAVLAREKGWRVIPYDCGSSVFSSDLRNMLKYFIWHLSGVDVSDTESTVHQLSAQFRDALGQYRDAAPVLMVIRHIDALGQKDLSLWYPKTPRAGIRFLISGPPMTVSGDFKEQNIDVYWGPTGGFAANEYIRLYLNKYHKQIDEQVQEALLQKAQGKSVRYLNALMERLITLEKADFDRIQQAGSGIQAISSYLCAVVNQQPDSLSQIIRHRIDALKKELSPEFVDGALCVLAATPSGIPAEHLEALLKESGCPWSYLDFACLRQRLSHLITDTAQGFLRLADSELRKEIQNIYLTQLRLWQDRLLGYIQKLPFEDDLYKKQSLLLAQTCGDPHGLWHYLHRAGNDDGYALLMLRRILSRPEGLNWLERCVDVLPTAREPAKLADWCGTRLYPWIRTEELLSEDQLPLWEKLSQLTGRLYAEAPSHHLNSLHYSALFHAGEACYLLHQEEKAEKHLLKAVEVAREDMSRWPNKIRKMMLGLPLTDEDRRRALEMAPEGVDAQTAMMLGYGTEMEDAVAGISYSATNRVAYQYLGNLYSRRGDTQLATAYFEKVSASTRAMDPNPDNAPEAEVCPGVKVIMPWALDGSAAEKPKVSRYKPDYRRNTAIQLSKQAQRHFHDKDYEPAIRLLTESNQILLTIYLDGKTGDAYDLNGITEDVDEVRKRINSECLRDLGLNHKMLAHIYYQSGQTQSCRDAIDQGLSCCIEFDNLRNSQESKLDLEDMYFVALHYYHYMNDEEMTFRTACSLQTACCAAIRAGGPRNTAARERMELACQEVLAGLKADPSRGEVYLNTLVELCNDCMRLGDYANYSLLAVLALDLLELVVEKGWDWQVKQTPVEEILSFIVKSACDVAKHFNNWGNFLHYAKNIRGLSQKLRVPSGQIYCRSIFTDLAFKYFQDGNYAEAAQWYRLSYELMKPITPGDYLPVALFRDLGYLVPAYSESGQQTLAREYGEEALRYAREVADRGYGKAEALQGMSRQAWSDAFHGSLAELHLNLGINAGRMNQGAAMREHFHQALEYARKLSPVMEHQAKNITARVQAFQDSEETLCAGEDKRNENTIRQLLARLDEILKKAFDHPCGRSEAEMLASEARQALRELNSLPNLTVLLDPNRLLNYHFYCGHLYHRLGQPETALQILREGLTHEAACGDKALVAKVYSDMSGMTPDTGEQMAYLQKAITLQEALQSKNQLNDTGDLARSYFNYAVAALHAKKYAITKEYAFKAHAILSQLAGSGHADHQELLKECTRLCNLFK